MPMRLAIAGQPRVWTQFLAEQTTSEPATPWGVYGSVGVAVLTSIGAILKGWQSDRNDRRAKAAEELRRQSDADAKLERTRREIAETTADQIRQGDRERGELRERLTRSEGAIEHLTKELNEEREQNRRLININAELRNDNTELKTINADLRQRLDKTENVNVELQRRIADLEATRQKRRNAPGGPRD